jgi:hypothetical protein
MRVAIAVTDLQTFQTISVNGSELHRSACTINMFALFAAVSEFEAGRADPSTVAGYIRSGIGSSYPPSVAAFLTQIFGSAEAGVARAQEMMRSWGMETSIYDHVPLFGDGTQYNLLTALETNQALTKLYRREMFDDLWTEYTLERLRDIDADLNYMIPAHLPSGVTVAHKMGYHWDYDGWVNNDAGIVTFISPSGKEIAYVISYFSEGTPSEYVGYSLGATLSKIVWDWFDLNYNVPADALTIENQLDGCLGSIGVVWLFDNDSKRWSGYQRGLPSELQGITELVGGATYALHASSGCTLLTPSRVVPIYEGWNFFVWR